MLPRRAIRSEDAVTEDRDHGFDSDGREDEVVEGGGEDGFYVFGVDGEDCCAAGEAGGEGCAVFFVTLVCAFEMAAVFRIFYRVEDEVEAEDGVFERIPGLWGLAVVEGLEVAPVDIEGGLRDDVEY